MPPNIHWILVLGKDHWISNQNSPWKIYFILIIGHNHKQELIDYSH
jgi:hypothetical protein